MTSAHSLCVLGLRLGEEPAGRHLAGMRCMLSCNRSERGMNPSSLDISVHNSGLKSGLKST